jgi:hypothetical protein
LSPALTPCQQKTGTKEIKGDKEEKKEKLPPDYNPYPAGILPPGLNVG